MNPLYSSGTYRDAWRFERPGETEFVIKRMMMDDEYTHGLKDLTRIRNEAIIMERLSSSPRIVGIYGHCGTSVLMEAMVADVHTKIMPTSGLISQDALDRIQINAVVPMNSYTAAQKFKIALEMAEALADIHGFEGGPIIHCDTHIEQWLEARDGSLKLNDFNNAHISRWNPERGEYCTKLGRYGGNVRSTNLSLLVCF